MVEVMRTAKKKPFSDSRKRSNYRVTNNREYNNILRNRGRIDFMISRDLSSGWYECYDTRYRKVGGQNQI